MATNKEDRSFKTLINRQTTDENKAYYEELGAETLIITDSQIWSQDVPDNDPASGISSGVVGFYSQLALTEDITVSNQEAWYAEDVDGYRLKDWISDRFGADYTVRLYDNAGSQIFPTDALDWFFDYPTGILTINGDASVFSQPFKIDGYRYIGTKGSNEDSSLVFSSIAERNSLNSVNRFEGMRVRVLDVNATYELIGGTTDGYWTQIDAIDYSIQDQDGIFIYVSTAGNDETGDGSAGNPYRQPQRAVDSIPKESNGQYVIQCGAGSFEFPRLISLSPGVRLMFVGSRDNEVTSGEFTYNQVSGTQNYWEANIGAHGETVTDGSHWILFPRDFVSFGFGLSYIAFNSLASSSPNFRIMAGFDITGFYGTGYIYPVETTFTRSRYVGDVSNTSGSARNNVQFFGIEIDDQIGSNFSSKNFQACKFTSTTSSSRVIVLYNCRSESYFDSNISQCSMLDGGFLRSIHENSLYLANGYFNITTITRDSSVDSQIVISNSTKGGDATQVFINGCDFEGTRPCFEVAGGTLVQQNNVVISNSPSRFIYNLETGGNYLRRSGTITGSTTSVPINLINGGQAINIKVAADGTLTNSSTPGDEIEIGGLGTYSFSDLPLNDFGMGPNSQGCRAN